MEISNERLCEISAKVIDTFQTDGTLNKKEVLVVLSEILTFTIANVTFSQKKNPMEIFAGFAKAIELDAHKAYNRIANADTKD